MAPLREVDPTGLYHVMSRGNFRDRIFLDDDHFARYIHLLQRVSDRRAWSVLDWCLIPNHYHLLVQLTDGGLSDGMRELNGCFSRWSNLQTGRTGTGHVVKNRFTSIEVTDDGYLFEVLRYIPNNPVRAGLVSLPEDWRWCGYRANVGLENPYAFHRPAELLRYFSPGRTAALERYLNFVREGRVPNPSRPLVRPSVTRQQRPVVRSQA
jgi:REP element-mobilizing transposase RayT